MLFLDFDGVICDSLTECLVSSWLAYYTLFKKEEPDLVPIDLKKRFALLRPYVRYGGEYLLIQQLLEAYQAVCSQADFDKLVAQSGQTNMSLFKELLYKVRESLLRTEKSYWLSLNPLYSHMHEPLQRLARNKYVHIVSTKRSALIREILDAQGIYFPPERIHDADEQGKKRVITELLAEYKQQRAIFIDDHIDHLKQVQDVHIEVYLATWGYIQSAWLDNLGSIKSLNADKMVDLVSRYYTESMV